MTLLDNAATSIRVGVEDYLSKDSGRVLSAVRNIYAGILLLFKEKLRRMSPNDSDEVLLKQNIKPAITGNGTVSFQGAGKKTVDLEQIRQRLGSLGIDVDWKPVTDISKFRNDIEHYFTLEAPDRLREIIADTFVIVRDFTTRHLDTTPLALLGEDTWQHILRVASFYQKELAECRTAQLKLEWPNEIDGKLEDHLRCPECNSELIKPIITDSTSVFLATFSCSSCDEESEYPEVAEAAVQSRYFADAYIAMTDGGEPPYDTCPECCKDTYLLDSDVCAACGYGRKYLKCAICHTGLTVGDQIHKGLCSYHARQADKDD